MRGAVKSAAPSAACWVGGQADIQARSFQISRSLSSWPLLGSSPAAAAFRRAALQLAPFSFFDFQKNKEHCYSVGEFQCNRLARQRLASVRWLALKTPQEPPKIFKGTFASRLQTHRTPWMHFRGSTRRWDLGAIMTSLLILSLSLSMSLVLPLSLSPSLSLAHCLSH